MAEERTLGIARAREGFGEEESKESLQRRMEEARDSISNTVTEIKENVTQQYENVKDALDWREHYKKQPVAWSLGAAGVGFFVGYGIASALSEDRSGNRDSGILTAETYARPLIPEAVSAAPVTTNGKDDGPGMLARFKDTSAYERLSKEAGSLGDRLVEELSTTAQEIVLPALLKKIKTWIGVDLSNKTPSRTPSMGGNQERNTASYQPTVEQAGEV